MLLDNNVWAYLVREDQLDELTHYTRRSPVSIVIAPGVVYEHLRTPNQRVRADLVEASTRVGWERLMTEVYYDAAELVAAIAVHRPSWLRDAPDSKRYRELETDWRRGHAWTRIRRDPVGEAAKIARSHPTMMSDARTEGKAVRADHVDRGLHQEKSVNLLDQVAQRVGPIPGIAGDAFDVWRVTQAESWRRLLARGRGGAWDWVAPWVDVVKMLEDESGWNRFWILDVTESEMRRAWVHWAVGLLQSLRKHGPGNPVDRQIASHLLDVELMISADKAFCEIAADVHVQAPFQTARISRLLDPSNPMGEIERLVSEWSNLNMDAT